ncbi:MAG: hypothetical protein U0270_44055 [Labilithrix sp.]
MNEHHRLGIAFRPSQALTLALALACASVTLACEAPTPEEARGSTTSRERAPSDELLENARLSRPTPNQIRIESTVRDACKGRTTIFDIKVGNNSESSRVPFSAVAHGYRNAETIPAQITQIGYFDVAPVTVGEVSFDGEYPGRKGAAIEVVSVTLDATGDVSLEDVGISAKFYCGEVEDTNAGYDPTTSEVQNPSAVSCATLGQLRGAELPMCEFNGNGACNGQGAPTNDCSHCCQATGPGTTAPLY